MNLPRRPWALSKGDPVRLGSNDCFLVEGRVTAGAGPDRVRLLDWQKDGTERALYLLPYPKLGHAEGPPVVHGLPVRPKASVDPETEEARKATEALGRMNRVVARLQELEAALDDPGKVWSRLDEAWQKAGAETDTLMAEIVRQARDIRPRLQSLENRIRRVLRRTREMTPLDRVQEMDRASMLWLVRQPGRTTAQRAGARQRVLATVRHENFDTLENRVLHAYVTLAADVAREWIREHSDAHTRDRYVNVDDYRRYCDRLIRVFSDRGVGCAAPGITPNYVLMDDRDYRLVYEAWIGLVHKERAIDDLWAWQAQSWTDFCTLAVTLSLFKLDEAVLVAQSPIIRNEEAVTGRWFKQDNPLAVFWLRDMGRIVEVQARPVNVSSRQAAVRAHVWLKLSDIHGDGMHRRIPVWTLHCFRPREVIAEVQEAASALQMAQQVPAQNIMKNGLVLMQAFGEPQVDEAISGGCTVRGLSLDAAGPPLALGMCKLGAYVQGLVLETAT